MTDIPELLRPYMEPDAEGKGVRLIPVHEGMPCIGMLSIPAVQFDTVKARFSDALKRAPVCLRETPANAAPRVLFLCPDIPADITNRQIAHEGITAIFGGNRTLIKGEWNIQPEVTELPEVPFDDISDLVSGKGTPHEQEKTSPQEKTPTIRRIEYPRCFFDPAGIGGTAAFAYDDAQKVPCDQSGRTQAPAEGLLPFDQINLAKIDNIKMFLRVSLGGYIKKERKRVEKPIPIVILDYDHVLNPDTGDYADGIPDELRDEIEYLKKHTYCEFSQSRSGIHAFCIDNLPEPVTKGDKPFLKIKADSKPEIFRGDSQVLCTGWRIPDACDDIHEIDISAIYTRQLGKSSVGKTPGRKKAGAEASPEFVPDPMTEPEELTDEQIADLRDWIRDEAEYVANVLSEDYLQTTRRKKKGGKMGASELMMSVMVRICLDMAPAAISTGIPYHLLATPAHVERLWKCSEVYQTYYGSGQHKYNDSKVNTTVQRAIDIGRARYIELYNAQLPKREQETA